MLIYHGSKTIMIKAQVALLMTWQTRTTALITDPARKTKLLQPKVGGGAVINFDYPNK
jgi:hypothetical protein